MGQWQKGAWRPRLLLLVAIGALISWAAYITWSIVRLDNMTGKSAVHRTIVEEELSGRELAKALGVSAWKITILPGENRRHLTGVQLRVVDTATNAQSIIATSPFNPTDVQHIQVCLMPIPLGSSLMNSEEIDVVFTVEGGRSRQRISNPFFGKSCAERDLPADLADDLVLLTTVEFVKPEDVGKNIGKLPSVKLMITFVAEQPKKG